MQNLDGLTDEQIIAMLPRLADQNKLLMYRPAPDGQEADGKNGYIYPWQQEFHDIGSYAKERLLMAANGVGKTVTVGAELAIHATGRYPEWWQGYRLRRGGYTIWIGSIDNDMQKIGLQKVLLGEDLSDSLGTGFIPAGDIQKINLRQSGVKDVVDEAFIRHQSGSIVKMKFKTYEQGWRKWQSGDPKIIGWDEEPDENNVDQKDVHAEVLTRLVRNNGIFIGGYTPLIGETALTKHFMDSEDPSIRYMNATWDDAPHMDPEARARIMEGYPEHQRDTRSKGIPMIGEGAIFRVSESDFVVDPIRIPDYWPRIKGVDFGLAHPAALVCAAWDRDNDCVYIYNVWRKSNAITRDHADVINAVDRWIPVAWPHDGEQRDKDSGERLHAIYRDRHGCAMLSKSARYKNDKGGAQSQWAIIEDVRIRLQSGRLKVFRTCKPWLEEYRSYHTKDGKIVSKRDDALKASFYALMMLRYSRSKAEFLRSGRPKGTPAPFRTAV